MTFGGFLACVAAALALTVALPALMALMFRVFEHASDWLQRWWP